ncbi:tryptophan halogenase family protein [Bowmanella dokdonensis]|nr:tryptophan halogenase family protein [Bowmanella dokdonensis]
MTGEIRHVVVLGGGTAGWLAANHLARRLQSHLPDTVQVSLIESPDIPTIGVGEGTVPAIRSSLHHLGISETRLLREADATFKQSIKFVGWMKPRQGAAHSYHHLFDYPDILDSDPTPAWLQGKLPGMHYADAVSVQGRFCDAGLGPKLMTQPEYAGISQYAYHIDAAKFGKLLAEHGSNKLGVRHIRAHVTSVKVKTDGGIDSLITDCAGEIQGDLYVDASGFNALLLSQTMNIPLVDKSHVLLADTALAVQVPYSSPAQPIACHTLATAQHAGWIWDIGLTERRGVGYVYSSSHTSHEQAEHNLRDYLGPLANDLAMRRIPMQVGYRKKFWHKNCVAIGLSQGFVEPLEATGLLMFDITSRMLADQFPAHQAQIDQTAGRFNRQVSYAWERVVDFIKLHYCISDRDDSEFWLDNRHEQSIPQSLQENLEYWRYQLPSHYDFTNVSGIFNLENYLYVLYGMHYPTQIADRPGFAAPAMAAEQKVQAMQKRAAQLAAQMLPHRELINRIRQYGLQRI